MRVDKLEVIGVRIPGPKWLFSVPGDGMAIFGRHYGPGTIGMGNPFGFRCDRDLVLRRPDGQRIVGSSEEQIIVACSNCDFQFVLGHWREAIYEWAMIAFCTSLKSALHSKHFREEACSLNDMITVCRTDDAYLNDMVGNLWDLVGPNDVIDQKYTVNAQEVPAWEKHGIAVANLLYEPGTKNQLLLVWAGLLLTQLEKSFQDGIKSSAQSVLSSASALFHPESAAERRNREP